jgi:hypothetical protein
VGRTSDHTSECRKNGSSSRRGSLRRCADSGRRFPGRSDNRPWREAELRKAQPPDIRSRGSHLPQRSIGSAELSLLIEHTAPAVLGLLADGVPRGKRAIVAALAGQQLKEDVVRALMRLAVTGRVVEHGGKFTLPPADEPAEG